MRLIDYIKLRGFTSSQAREILETGKVFYCQVPTADGGREVDTARVEIKPNAARLRPGRDLAIIFRDAYLAIVWKPAGLLSMTTVGRRQDPNVISQVAQRLGTAFAVHRLDEPTSGLMMVALNEDCQQRLKAMLFEHRVERRYRAIVQGWFPETSCTVRSVLVRDRGDGRRGSSVDLDEEDGRVAVTHLRLVQTLGRRASLVEARLETGRTHQVRIHLTERKHPILGEDVYAGPAVARAAPRLALHACELGLIHPMTGANLFFEAALADDLETLRRKLLRGDAPGRAINDRSRQKHSPRR